jgi:hypothetical protein
LTKEVMTMPVLTRSRQALRVAGTASAAAPYLREAVSDSDLRDSFRSGINALSRIYDEMAADQRLRDHLFDRVAAQAAAAPSAPRFTIPVSRRFVAVSLMAIGFVVGAAAIVTALAMPRSRQRLGKVAADARQNVVSLAGRVRRTAPEPVAEPAETAETATEQAA